MGKHKKSPQYPISFPTQRPQQTRAPKLIQSIQAFSGPLPSPETLAKYSEIIPNGAERIMKMAEDQARHRQSLEKTVIGGDSKRAYCGLFVGGTVALCILGASVYCILRGHDVAGTVIGSLDIASIVGVFVYGTNRRRAEREQKTQTMVNPNSLK